MSKVDKDTVRHISKLIRIHIPEDELDLYSNNLKTSLDCTKVFEELNTKNVKTTSQTVGTKNIMREDFAKGSLSQEEALKNSSGSMNGYFVVKKVI